MTTASSQTRIGPPADRLKSARQNVVLWGPALIVSFALHAGGAIWLFRDLAITPADNSPPPAIMIELAPEPEVALTETIEISPEVTETVESASEPVEESSPAEPVETVEATEPTPDPAIEPIEPDEPAETEPVEEQILTIPENAEVPIPAARPKPPAKREAHKEIVAKKPERKPKKEHLAPAAKAVTQAKAQVRQSDRTAARQTSAGLFSSSVTPAKWQSRLMAHLERRKRYPSGARSRGETGVAYVRFSIDNSGNVLSARVARSSGFPELDLEVVDLVRRASPVPAPPPEANKTITAPVRFSAR